MDNASTDTGFPLHWFIAPIQKVMVCNICCKVLNNPHQCKNGHCFCLSCISTSLIACDECPVCHVFLDANVLCSNACLRNLISDLVVCCICDLSSNGKPTSCKWTGTLEQLCAHIPECPSMQMTDCPLFSVDCCPGCSGKVKTSKLSEHLHKSPEGYLMTITELIAKIHDLNDNLNINVSNMSPQYGVINSDSGEVYTGDVLGGVKHGQGSMSYAGLTDFYSGQWLNDYRCGYGMKLWPDGASYHGDWLNGAMHGSGIFTYSNGDKFIGRFQNDLRHGSGTLQHFNGEEVIEGVWKNDEMVRCGDEESQIANLMESL